MSEKSEYEQGYDTAMMRAFSQRGTMELRITELEAENDRLRHLLQEDENIIRGMLPMWVAAMSYCEHGYAADLDRMRNYYSGRDNPLTGEELQILLSKIK